MFKIFQARLQQYVNWELLNVQARFWRGRGTRDQIASVHWIMEKAREFQTNICFIDYTKAFDSILEFCLLRNLYAGQEQKLTTGDGTTDWFPTGKEAQQSGILSPCLFNFSVEYIMRNARLHESQAGSRLLEEISTVLDMQMIWF